MTDSKNISDLTKGIIGDVPDKVYDDLLHKSVKPIGDIISLAPRVLKVLTNPIEKWILQKEDALNQIPNLISQKHAERGTLPEDIVEPENYVAVPALQSISYSMDSEDLRDLFANLLASATDRNRKDNIHPSYVEIIKQLSPIDAKLLKYIGLNHNMIVPSISVVQKYNNTSFTNTILNRVIEIDSITVTKVDESLYNLNRLGIVQFDDQSLPSDYYSDFFKHIYNESDDNSQYSKIYNSIRTTLFGLNFIQSCVI